MINSVSSRLLTSIWLVILLLVASTSLPVNGQYQRNQAVPVEKVDFGRISSIRDISQTELLQDKASGWKVFGGALIGGVIGHHVGHISGSRSVRSISTILGALIGGSAAAETPKMHRKVLRLIELMITTEDGKEYMVIQDYDPKMLFTKGDAVRIVYLATGYVRVDKQL